MIAESPLVLDNNLAIQMRNINKTFPGPVYANKNINLEIKKGEIHALLGENGAGKTTLMNVLYGLYGPDDENSKIFVNGREVKITEPMDAMNVGIGMVHQHFMLIPIMTVTENCGLGIESTFHGIRMNEKEMRSRLIQISRLYGLEIDPDRIIEDLPVGLQQRVEILKILYREADILILDEPTAVLTPQEVSALFKTLETLKNQGKTIVLITHKLKEPMALADRITVLRRGELIGTVEKTHTTIEELAEMMIGRKLKKISKSEQSTSDVQLEIRDLFVKDDRFHMVVKGISLSVYGGEILGLAGVVGNGQRELAEAITGLRPTTEGRIFIGGKDMTNKTPRYLYDHGLAFIPEDRQKTGSIGTFTVAENLIIGVHHRKEWYMSGFFSLFLNSDKISVEAKKKVKDFDIRTPTIETTIKNLSGGNQQKVIVARELSKNPSIIVASQPTRGLDVGVIEYVHRRLLELRNDGKGVLLISSDLDEILTLSDRIAIIYEGEIIAIEDPNETNERRLGLLMAGQSLEK